MACCHPGKTVNPRPSSVGAMPGPEIKNASDGWGRASYKGWKTNDIWWLGKAIMSGTLDSVVGRVSKGTLGRARRSGQILIQRFACKAFLLRVLNA